MENVLLAQNVLGLLSILLVGIEFLHAREEKRDAFATNPERKFSGLEFSDRVETYKSKTQVAFMVYKAMMLLIFVVIALFAFPSLITKTLAFALVGVYLLYQWHHLSEWYLHKKDNHGRRTAWMYVPTAIVWWWMIVILITNLNP